jgi:hypothetical protein
MVAKEWPETSIVDHLVMIRKPVFTILWRSRLRPAIPGSVDQG